MRRYLTLLWLAASSPRRFFEALEPEPVRIVRAGRVAFSSLLVLSLMFIVGVARVTASDAWPPLIAAALVGAVAAFLYAWAFGSIFVQRPGSLDMRAWEVTGWSWAPALFGSLSMLVPLLVLPAVALPLLLVVVILWHCAVLRVGLSVFLGRPAGRIVTLYALFIYALPLALLGLVVWLTGQLQS